MWLTTHGSQVKSIQRARTSPKSILPPSITRKKGLTHLNHYCLCKFEFRGNGFEFGKIEFEKEREKNSFSLWTVILK
jgi:hypothetical protein